MKLMVMARLLNLAALSASLADQAISLVQDLDTQREQNKL